MKKLVMDIGQTATRTCIESRGAGENIRVSRGLNGSGDVLKQVLDLVALALTGTKDVEQVLIGCSGLDDIGGAANIVLEGLWRHTVSRVVIAHDSVTSTLGALRESHGVVLAIGTGIVAMGVGPVGAVRVDGWGSVLDDAGSAYWIGRAGIQAALRQADGRGAATALSARIASEFGALNHISGIIQQLPTRVADVARFARVVTELAEEGDIVARSICDSAIDEWLTSAGAASNESGLTAIAGSAPHLSWSGAVLTQSDFLRERLRKAAMGKFELHAPLGTALDGAALLAISRPESPLQKMIDDSLPKRKTRS